MEQKGIIYALECPIDKKIKYVGQTRRKLNIRLAQHIRRVLNKKGRLTKKEAWIKKLINENLQKQIKLIVLEECDIKELDNREKYWILKIKENHDLTNLTEGGNGVILNTGEKNKGRILSEESKKKISEANSGEKNGMYGKRYKVSDERKEKSRINMINSEKFQSSRKSEEFRNKISDIVSIPVVVLDDDLKIIMEFKNTTKCAEFFKYTRSNIKHAVKDLRQIGKGKKDKYWIVRKEKLEDSINKIKIKIHEKKIS